MAPSFLSLTLQENDANILMASRFDWLLISDDCLILTQCSLVYFSGLKYILAR